MAWFASRNKRGNVLDVGCGQGRNAIPLAKMGYRVHAIDVSEEAVDQLKIKNQEPSLELKVEKEDVCDLEDFSRYDIILLDGFFHFNPHERESDREMMNFLIRSAVEKTVFVFCFADHGDSLEQFHSLAQDLLTLESESIFYTYRDPVSEWEFETAYALFVMKRKH